MPAYKSQPLWTLPAREARHLLSNMNDWSQVGERLISGRKKGSRHGIYFRITYFTLAPTNLIPSHQPNNWRVIFCSTATQQKVISNWRVVLCSTATQQQLNKWRVVLCSTATQQKIPNNWRVVLCLTATHQPNNWRVVLCFTATQQQPNDWRVILCSTATQQEVRTPTAFSTLPSTPLFTRSSTCN